MSSAPWTGVVSDEVTAHVLRYREDNEVLRRFFAKVDYGFDAGDCHVWTGGMSDEGYGVFALPRGGGPKRVVRAHRAAYLWKFGPPPEETPYLDHPVTCVGRFCVNPMHMEPVNNYENSLRAQNVGREPQRAMRSAELLRRQERHEAGDWGIF